MLCIRMAKRAYVCWCARLPGLSNIFTPITTLILCWKQVHHGVFVIWSFRTIPILSYYYSLGLCSDNTIWNTLHLMWFTMDKNERQILNGLKISNVVCTKQKVKGITMHLGLSYICIAAPCMPIKLNNELYREFPNFNTSEITSLCVYKYMAQSYNETLFFYMSGQIAQPRIVCICICIALCAQY